MTPQLTTKRPRHAVEKIVIQRMENPFCEAIKHSSNIYDFAEVSTGKHFRACGQKAEAEERDFSAVVIETYA
jgi:hypothetical protein